MTLPVAGLPETSDARLEACLARIEARDGFPALTQRIQELTAVLGDEDASVQRLANIVLRDYGLTLRVIRAANSFHYNRSGMARRKTWPRNLPALPNMLSGSK